MEAGKAGRKILGRRCNPHPKCLMCERTKILLKGASRVKEWIRPGIGLKLSDEVQLVLMPPNVLQKLEYTQAAQIEEQRLWVQLLLNRAKCDICEDKKGDSQYM